MFLPANDGSENQSVTENSRQEVKLESHSPNVKVLGPTLSDSQPVRVSSMSNKGIPPVRYSPQAHFVYIPELQDYNEVLKLEPEEKVAWFSVMQEEFNSSVENKVSSMAELHKGKSPVDCCWLFKVKYGPKGQCQRKAQLVARGFSQVYGQDYDEVFSPTMTAETLRIAL